MVSPKRYYRHMTPAKAADIRRRYNACGMEPDADVRVWR